MIKTCPVCGQPFMAEGIARIYCGDRCRKRRWTATHPRTQKICLQCGKQFIARSRSTVLCRVCREALTDNDRDREHTVDTAYLCQKRHREGMDTREIAEILRRSVESVNLALAVRLGPEDYAMMEEYAR